jgi:branched-chain amino acid transport system permease protein
MLLELVEISRDFGGVRALDRVSFAVEAGEIHGLIGPNGAGKTTLINIISGITRPTSGCVHFRGEPIQELPSHRVAALGVARTFQNIRLFPAMTCLENVIAGQHLTAKRPLLPRLLNLPSARRQERDHREHAMACLHRVGIHERAAFLGGNLSYGERRRLEIARALASSPRLLLLDEPVAGMHRSGMQQVSDLIRSLAAEGMTVLLIEHHMAFVMELCSRITVLNFGRVITTGTPAEVACHPQVIEAYLGGDRCHA